MRIGCLPQSLSYIQIFSPVFVSILAVNIALLWTFLLSPLLFVKGLNKFAMQCVAVQDPLANTKYKLKRKQIREMAVRYTSD